MYSNLLAEMARCNITRQRLSALLDINNGTLSQKLNGKSDFTLPQAFAIKRLLDTDLPIDVLFAKEEG